MLKDNEIASLVNDLRRIAIRHHADGQLRDLISQVVVDAMKKSQREAQPQRHLYHVNARFMPGDGQMLNFDAVIDLEDVVESDDCYQELKRRVGLGFTPIAPPEKVAVTSLSYLGAFRV